MSVLKPWLLGGWYFRGLIVQQQKLIVRVRIHHFWIAFIDLNLTIYYFLALDYFEAIINIHKEHLHDTFILLLTNYWIENLTGISTVTTDIKFVLWSLVCNCEYIINCVTWISRKILYVYSKFIATLRCQDVDVIISCWKIDNI